MSAAAADLKCGLERLDRLLAAAASERSGSSRDNDTDNSSSRKTGLESAVIHKLWNWLNPRCRDWLARDVLKSPEVPFRRFAFLRSYWNAPYLLLFPNSATCITAALRTEPGVFVLRSTDPGIIWYVQYEGTEPYETACRMDHPTRSSVRREGDTSFHFRKRIFATFRDVVDSTRVIPFAVVGAQRCRELLGSGAFGNVYRCSPHAPGDDEQRVVKVVHFHLNVIGDKFAEREIRVLEYVADLQRRQNLRLADDDNYLVTLHDATVDREQKRAYLLLSRIEGTELFHWINARDEPPRSRAVLVTVFVGLVRAVRQLHEMQVAHLDIKPENFIIQPHNQHKLYLVDFGFACIVTAGPGADKDLYGRRVGTESYCAPELNLHGFRFHTDRFALDIFSLGQTMLSIWDHCSRRVEPPAAATGGDGSSLDAFIHYVRSSVVALDPQDRPTIQEMDGKLRMLLVDLT